MEATSQQRQTRSGPPIVAARLTPVVDARNVSRPRLLDAVDEGVRRPLTLVAAPAGAGKTVLLSEWAQRQPPETVAWLTLDPRDNDRRCFWFDLTAAVAHATGRGAGALGALEPPPRGEIDGFLATFANAAAAHARRLVLILDDAQEVHSIDVLHDVDALVAQAGSRLRVVWATRVDPTLRLQRLRIAGDLGEIRLADLAFTLPEARQLLDVAPDVLSRADIERLWTKTSGWAAGLRIAALGLRGHDDPHAFATTFSGDQCQILDYLLDEVVAGLPEPTTAFLLRTAGVRELCAPLADALTESDDSAAILDDLFRRNLLIAPGDSPRESFRFHPLFAEGLRFLQRQRIEAEIPELHRRAARWYAGDGQPAEAIRHACEAADWAFAGELAAEHWMALGLAGHAPALRALTARFPPSVVHDDAEIALAVGGLALEEGDEEEADYFLEVAAARAAELPEERRRRYEVHAAVTRLYRGNPDVDPRTAIDAGRRVLANRWDRGMETSLRALARLSVGVAELWLGDLTAAGADLEEAGALAAEADNGYLTVQTLGWSALIDVLEGRLVEADRGAEAAVALARLRGAERDPQAAPAFAALAVVRWQWNEIAPAEEALARARTALGSSGNRSLNAWLAVVGAHLHAVRGEPETGIHLLRGATAEHQGHHLPPMLVDAANGAAARLRLLLGEHDRATDLCRGLETSEWGASLSAAATIRLGLRQPDEALLVSDRLLALPGVLPLSEIVGWTTRALACDMLGEPDAAERALERALDLAEPRGYRRPLLDAGSRVGMLLRRLIRQGTAHRALVGELLGELDRPGTDTRSPTATVTALAEPLSERELAVLRYMPTTLPYPEVASELFVSVNTIKTHVRHVYRKLDVDNRRDAVARGRALRLLGPTTSGR